MKKNYEIVLFDLDGTLTDPKEGITKSIQYSLNSFGIEEELDNLEQFIGPPLHATFKDYYKFEDEKATEAIEKYREYFSDRGIFENKIYKDIKETLKILYENGKTLLLATSKPTVFAETILKYFGIDSYFKYIAGSNLDGTRVNKNEVIEYVLDLCGVTDKDKVIMIGDRKYDIIGANKIGVDSIGVLYGYGSFDEISKSNPTYIVESVKSIKDILL
ncbi:MULTISPECIES: HAD family hydrolase [unclassified Clostridioides]|uniref:HAD family hydrolase n=1 Tax=unclassified Clostridioides TaxID=2635829 RepID=UPI001D0FB736|nr:HAD family hydrolase [Clostridioides sp. ES-S-0049-03]MCC0670942.1 HAD family hydrolase [Clostridioides sp. ES-S-0145-01]MCC0677512.1 HAD family hydrolase [Clostridioides sp. ES-W-0018-02]MCC0712248.1 HAD family hydrolase [Clostridioides sp. ES-W-0017-02]